MTEPSFEQAIAILRAKRHRGFAGWVDTGQGWAQAVDEANGLVHQYENLERFEVVAIAEKYMSIDRSDDQPPGR